MPKKRAASQHPAVAVTASREYTKLERNLEKLPIFTVEKVSRLMERTTILGPGRILTVRTTSSDGLPGGDCRDVWVALLKLWNDFRGSPPPDRVIRGMIRDIAQVLERPRGGKTWDQLRHSLREIRRVDIEQVGVFRRPDGTYIEDKGFKLLNEVRVEHRVGDNGAATFEAEVSATIASNIEAGYYRLLDMGIYNSLGGGGGGYTPKRMYSYLDASRYRGKDIKLFVLQLPLLELREYIPLSPVTPSQLLRVLDAANTALYKHGVIGDVFCEKEGRSAKDHYLRYVFADAPADVRALATQPVQGALLLGDGAEPHEPEIEAPRQGPDEDTVLALVQDMLDVLGDEHSRAFYLKVAKTLHVEVTRAILSEARQLKQMRSQPIRNIRRIFTAAAQGAAEKAGLSL
jgi:hypothetical protein